VNRRQRRASSRREDSSAKRIRELQHHVEATGKPGRIHGLVDACVDCGATGDLILLPGRLVVGEMYHDPSCPAAAGITEWKPVSP
jgi:hypothetical protein